MMGIGGEANGTFGEGGGLGLRFDGGLGLRFDGGLGLRFDGGLGLRFDGGARVIYMDLVTPTLTEPLYPSFEHVVWDMGERGGRRYDSIFYRHRFARPYVSHTKNFSPLLGSWFLVLGSWFLVLGSW